MIAEDFRLRARGEKRPVAVPALRWRPTPIRLRPNPTALREGAASAVCRRASRFELGNELG